MFGYGYTRKMFHSLETAFHSEFRPIERQSEQPKEQYEKETDQKDNRVDKRAKVKYALKVRKQGILSSCD